MRPFSLLASLFAYLLGAHYLPRARVCGAITLVNLTGFMPGVASTETGINIKTFKVAVEPEFKTFAENKDGTKRGFGVAPMKLVVTLDGEVTGNTGIMAAVPGTACVLSNSTAYFGAPTTGTYLDKANVNSNREQGAWQEMDAEFSANAGIP